MLFPIESIIGSAVLLLIGGILYWLVQHVAPVVYFFVNLIIIALLLAIVRPVPAYLAPTNLQLYERFQLIAYFIALGLGAGALILVFTPSYRWPWIWDRSSTSWRGGLHAVAVLLFCVFYLLIQWVALLP